MGWRLLGLGLALVVLEPCSFDDPAFLQDAHGADLEGSDGDLYADLDVTTLDPDPFDAPAPVDATPLPPALPPVVPNTPVPTLTGPWSFAVLSDIHAPNDGHMWPTIQQTVAALVAMHVRAVVITGDFTNGAQTDGPVRVANAWRLWTAIRTALLPLRAAGIAVLPVAGNHDSYLPGHRALYARAWADLDAWAQPFRITSTGLGTAQSRAPFSYGVDVGDVHFTLAHLVDRRSHPDVEAWLAADLDAAKTRSLRFVFGHVPMSSVAVATSKPYLARLGSIFERGHADVAIFGHEHLIWDEDVKLPGGGTIREILTGCTSGFYNYGPSHDSMRRAHCKPTVIQGKVSPQRCVMPNGGGEFVIHKHRKGRMIQHARATFTVVTVDGTHVTSTPMTLDADGKAVPFYL